MRLIPFTMGDDSDDELSIRGTVAFGGAALTLALETSADGNRLETVRKVVIGVEEFVSCCFRRGLLGDRLQLRTASMGALGGIPGASMDTVTLHFDKADRLAAENLAVRIGASVSENHPPTQPVLWEHSAHP